MKGLTTIYLFCSNFQNPEIQAPSASFGVCIPKGQRGSGLQVSKYMGLGAEWKQRWVAVMPRYQLPSTQGSSQQRVARSLLVCYRSREQCEPVCKVWLDGAVARSVTGSLGSGFLQCALVCSTPKLVST